MILKRQEIFQISIIAEQTTLKFFFIGWSGWSSTTKNGILTVYYSQVELETNDFVMTIDGGTATLASSNPSSIKC